MGSVREATFEVARQHGMTTWFGNPGTTEIPLLADLPDDMRYVLALHENAAVGTAAGYAIASDRPAMVSLHTTAGLGNAVNSLATARVNRAPLVVLVGQQDRRHLLAEPFLTGELAGLAGDYPLEVFQPPRPQDVPGCVAQATHTAAAGRGPVLVIVPMSDWDEQTDEPAVPAPLVSRRASGVGPGDVTAIAALLGQAGAPVLVTGAGADSACTWEALARLAEILDCPVFQEPFTARAGFPQDNPRFAGFLPAGRVALRAALAPYDAVVVVGAAMLRQYQYEPGPLLEPGTRTAVISEDIAEVRRSPVDVGLVAPPAATVAALAGAVTPAPGRPGRPSPTGQADRLREQFAARACGMTPETLFTELAARAEPDTVVVEESPSSREALQLLVPARRPLGFLSAAMGGLGFGIPAAIGIRMARPDRPVLGVIGDGSSIYCIQALWTAAHYGVGVVIFVMGNARYLVMDRQAARRGKIPWPSLEGVRVDRLAEALGVPSVRVSPSSTWSKCSTRSCRGCVNATSLSSSTCGWTRRSERAGGRGAAWTEERGTSEEGRRCLNGARRRANREHSERAGGRGAAWTEERGTSEEGRRCLNGARRRANREHSERAGGRGAEPAARCGRRARAGRGRRGDRP